MCAVLLFVAFLAVLAVPVSAAPPPLQVKQTGAVEYTPSGPQITYQITITNQGSEPLSGVIVTDVLPAGSSLLYFSSSDGEQWSSTQGQTPEGPVALWRSEAPLPAGQSVHLRYTLSAPAGEVRVSKVAPRARAEGFDETVLPETIVVPVTPMPTPTSAPQPVASETDTSTATNAPGVDLTPTYPAALPSPTAAASAATPLPSPTVADDSSSRTAETGRFSIPVAVIVVVIIGVVAIILLIVTMRKR